MSKYDELKRLATLIVEVQTSQDVPISKLFDDFEAAACPETILALIAENERLEREAKNDLIAYKAVIERQNELRAENAGLKTGYQAYERVNAELKAEVEALKGQIGRLDKLDTLQIIADQARQIETLRNAAAPLDPVNGDQLPAINSKVLIHLSSCDAWVEHTVVGYYAWEDLGANEYLHRVFIRVRDAGGYLNARLLKDVRAVTALGQGEQS